MKPVLNRSEGQEEQYVLRVVDPALADKLRGALREDVSLSEQLKLSFPGVTGARASAHPAACALSALPRSSRLCLPALQQYIPLVCLADNGRQGTLTVDGVVYPVQVLDLPTTVESYKTYDDTNLVKSGDVGQVRLQQDPPVSSKGTGQAQIRASHSAGRAL